MMDDHDAVETQEWVDSIKAVLHYGGPERVRYLLGKAVDEAALGGARSFLYDTVRDMWDTVCAGNTPTARQLALGRIAATHAAETGAVLSQRANTLVGGSSIYSKSPLQRHARDAEAVTHHFTVAAHTWEEAGRVLLGRQPTVPVF